MIKTEQGYCRITGNDTTAMVDYIATTETLKDMLVKKMGMPGCQAKEVILGLVETAFADESEPEEKKQLQNKFPEKQSIFEKIRKWRKRK